MTETVLNTGREESKPRIYLDDYIELWHSVTEHVEFNRFGGAGLNRRQGNVQLAVNRVFNGTATLFKFYNFQEEAYLKTIADPEFISTIQQFGFECNHIQELVEKFRSYSASHKLANNVLSRILIGVPFGICGAYSLKITHSDKEKISEYNRSLRSKGLTFKQSVEAYRPIPVIYSCYERHFFAGEICAELAVVGLHPRDTNVIYRKFIEKAETFSK